MYYYYLLMNRDNNCPVFIINLESKEDQLIRTIKELRQINIFNNIIIRTATDKIDAKYNPFEYISYKAFNNIKNIKSFDILPTWGAVGCAISHYKCWQDILKSKLDYAIICEDDIKINDIKKFKFNYYQCIPLMKTNKALFISFNSENSSSYNYPYTESCDKNNTLKHIIGTFTGMSFYIINKLAIEKLLYLTPITYQIDIAISKFSIPDLQLLFFDDNSLKNYTHTSTVQYYFITLNELMNILIKYLPEDLIKMIYSLLPNKQNIIEKSNIYNSYNNSYNNY